MALPTALVFKGRMWHKLRPTLGVYATSIVEVSPAKLVDYGWCATRDYWP